MEAIFEAVDLTTVIAFVTGALVTGIGIALAFKGQLIGKKAIRQA